MQEDTWGGGSAPAYQFFSPRGLTAPLLTVMSVIFKNTTKNASSRHHSGVGGMYLFLLHCPSDLQGHRPHPAIFLSTHTHCSYLIRWRESWYALSLCKITKRSVHKQNYLRLNLCGAEILAERKSYSTLFSLVFCQRKRAARETSSASRRGHGNSAAEGRTTCTHRGT